MPKKPDDKGKVTGVKGAGIPEGVERAAAVSSVEKTQKTAPVAGVRGLANIGKTRPTRIMSAAEREHMFNMVHEEADRLFGKKGGLSAKQREVVESAVKMAIDAAIVEGDEEEKDPKNHKDKRER